MTAIRSDYRQRLLERVGAPLVTEALWAEDFADLKADDLAQLVGQGGTWRDLAVRFLAQDLDRLQAKLGAEAVDGLWRSRSARTPSRPPTCLGSWRGSRSARRPSCGLTRIPWRCWRCWSCCR